MSERHKIIPTIYVIIKDGEKILADFAGKVGKRELR